MAKTFGIDRWEDTTPSKYFNREWNNPDLRKLKALDDFRKGNVYIGLTTMGMNPSDSDGVLDEAYRLGYTLPLFDQDFPQNFVDHMRLIVRELDRVGY